MDRMSRSNLDSYVGVLRTIPRVFEQAPKDSLYGKLFSYLGKIRNNNKGM